MNERRNNGLSKTSGEAREESSEESCKEKSEEESCEIVLTQGKRALISPQDFERVSQYKWHAANNPRRSEGSSDKWYARRSARDRRPKYEYMHRFIMDAPAGCVTDHINGDSLDNRRSNLRFLSAEDNLRPTQFKKKSEEPFL